MNAEPPPQRDPRLPASDRFRAVRLPDNPVIRPGMDGLPDAEAGNINGPSLIRVPDGAADALGRYYLYFAHHGGSYIRLAVADRPEGPYRIRPGGVLSIENTPASHHVASPDVHVDEENRRLIMFYHGIAPDDPRGQVTFAAVSDDGLNWRSGSHILGRFYFRAFRRGGVWYAFAKNGNEGSALCRSDDPLAPFEPGPRFLPNARHTAVWIEGHTLHLFYSEANAVPERILVAKVDLSRPWRQWIPADPRLLLEPAEPWEGADLPLSRSSWGAVHGRVRQLRDPAVYEEDGRLYLLYSVAGESGIAVARLLDARSQ